jgi:hypothetical protein
MATNPGLARAFLEKLWPESESEPGYFAELGRMITAYASAEAVVHVLARHLSGMPDAKARAIFGGIRLSDLIKLIRQMMLIDKTPGDICQEVDACLVQLDAIAKQRHKLVHSMVDYAGSHLSVSNPLTAKSVTAIQSDVFSHGDLRNMYIDCQVISLRLHWVIAPQTDRDTEVVAAVRRPWRYKSPRRGSEKKHRRGSG